MTDLEWSEDIKVGIDVIDRDHEVAVSLLKALSSARGERLVEVFGAFAEHCHEHFASENALMEEYGFFATEVHEGEHERVLEELEHYRKLLAEGKEAEVLPYAQDSLPAWFLNHRNTMDRATAHFLNQMGYTKGR